MKADLYPPSSLEKHARNPISSFLPSFDRRVNGFLGLSLNDRTILYVGILLDKTVSVG